MPVWYLVPDGVVQYIEKRDLYREGPRRTRPAVVVGSDGTRPAGEQPAYDRPPESSASTPEAPGPDPGRPEPPDPYLQEMPR
jgi:nicotinate-nucleotide adenylyltransferase